MKKLKLIIALLLAPVMLLSCVPAGNPSTDDSSTDGSLTDTSSTDAPETPELLNDIYEDERLNAYRQYEGVVNDPTYVKGDVEYSVFYDKANATPTLDIVYYVVNWNDEGVGRIGKDKDSDIVLDLINSEASVQTGNRTAVVVLDYCDNELAKSPVLKNSLAVVLGELGAKGKLTVWADEAQTSTTAITVNTAYEYTLPAGYRLAKNIPFYEIDVHGALGTLDAMVKAWNSDIATKKTITYAYHTGNNKCTFDHSAHAGVECIAGAPQEIDGVVVTHAKQKAPKVSRPEDCRRADGAKLDYTLRLDIAYPSGKDVESTPIYVKVSSSGDRSISSSIATAKCKYDSHTNCNATWTYERGDLIDMMFSGCSVADFDHEYHPFARTENYGHTSNYSSYTYNSANVARAAIRCIRYYADTYGYNAELIGVGGISKASPGAGVLAMKDNKYIIESKTYKYTINGVSVETRGLYYEGDLNEDGSVTQGRTLQPYLTYEQGYNGVANNGGTEISSEVTVAYSAAGFGPRWHSGFEKSTDMLLGATNPKTGKRIETVPVVHSAGYHDEFNIWKYWELLKTRYNKYATEPYFMIAMEDQGHSIPNGIDPLRNYDRAEAYRQFMLSYLMPEKFVNSVAYFYPSDGAVGAAVDTGIQVQLIRPAESLAAFASSATVKDSNGNAVAGEWTTDKSDISSNNSGLYTFVPANGFDGSVNYTVTVGAPAVSEAVSATFSVNFSVEMTMDCLGDAYVSANEPDTAFGKTGTLLLNGGVTVGGKTYNENIIFLSYSKAVLNGEGTIKLGIPALNDASVNAEVLLVDNYCIDEETLTYNTMPDLKSAVSIGTYKLTNGNNVLELKGLADKVKGSNFTLAIRATDEVTYAFYNEFVNFTGDEDLTAENIDASSLIKHNTQTVDGKVYYHGYKNDPQALVSWTPPSSGNRRVTFSTRSGIADNYHNISVGFDNGLSVIRVFNSVSNGEMTKNGENVYANGINITGKTYRFSTQISSNTGSNDRNVKLGVASSVGDELYVINGDTNANNVIINNSTKTWVSGYYDYTIDPNHVKAEVSDGYSYPMFAIENVSKNFAYFGCFKTIELDKDGKELGVELRSREAESPESTLSLTTD